MKLINGNPIPELIRVNRKVEAELLRGMRLEHTQRCVSCYGRLAITAFTIAAFVVIIVLIGLGSLSLSNGALAALTVILCKVINGFFSKRE